MEDLKSPAEVTASKAGDTPGGEHRIGGVRGGVRPVLPWLKRRPTRVHGQVIAWVGLIALAAVVRAPFHAFASHDYTAFQSGWYDYLAEHGFAGVGEPVGNYPPLYLYLLFVATMLPVQKLLAIKLISIAFDVLIAIFAYRIVDHIRPGSRAPYLAAAAIVVTPTVVLNSSAWAQCDSVYAAFCLATVDFLIRRRLLGAAIFFGLAAGAKPQTIFLLPPLLIVLLSRREGARRIFGSAFIVVATFLVTLLPAAAAGASPGQLIDLYPSQFGQVGAAWGGHNSVTDAGGNKSVGAASAESPQTKRQVQDASDRYFAKRPQYRGGLTYNAANFYQSVPARILDIKGEAPLRWRLLGYSLASVTILGLAAWVLRKERILTDHQVLLVFCILTLAIPFFLPSMHDRYFYLAEVLTVITSFAVVRAWPAAVLVQGASLTTYLTYLWHVRAHYVLANVAIALALLLLLSVLRTRPVPSGGGGGRAVPESLSRGCQCPNGEQAGMPGVCADG